MTRKLLSSLGISLLMMLQVPMAVLAEETAEPPAEQQTPQQAEQPPAEQQTTEQPPEQETTPEAQPSSETSSQPAASSTESQSTQSATSYRGRIPDYAFNDRVRRWEPTIKSSFSYDEAQGLWVSPFYWYDPVVGWYHVKEEAPSSSVNALTAGSSDPSATLDEILGVSNTSTGPGSTNQATASSTSDLLSRLVNNISLNNWLASTATSGDATVSGNTNGGSAVTGLAKVVTNLLNLLNSLWSWNSGSLSYFARDFYGSQHGDVNLSVAPQQGGGGSVGQLACGSGAAANATTGPDSSNTATQDCQSNLQVNSQTTGSITNNIDMLAQSGDATVSGNTNGGSATSGAARAELNIINLINTAIGADQTFFGLINIYGQLNGDFLFPGLDLDQALASSNHDGSLATNSQTGPGSVNQADSTNQNDVDVTNQNNASFDNNIQASATSGDATVSGNTNGGSARTGTARTNTSLFNLFDTSIFGDNAVLVIVNNMGRWMGRIMSLTGSGTASLGALLLGNATVSNTNTGPDSFNQATASNSNQASIEQSTNGTITNNVNAQAHSGDATVVNNTNAGDAGSGDASVAANVANFFGSNLSLKRVFGILFINVFGNWFGSVGVDTEAGESSPPVSALPAATITAVVVQTSNSSSGGAVGSSLGGSGGSDSTTTTQVNSSSNASAKVASVNQLKSTTQQAAARKTGPTALLLGLTAGSMLIAGALFALERRLRTP